MNPEDLPPQIAESLKALGFLPTPPTTLAPSDDQFRRDLLAVLNRIADNLQPEMFPALPVGVYELMNAGVNGVWEIANHFTREYR